MITLSTLHDPEGRFLPLVKKAQKELKNYFAGTIISYTDQTNQALLQKLRQLEFLPVPGGLWGESRKSVLEEALQTQSRRFFFCDFDKILHWLSVAEQELKQVLTLHPPVDFLVFGRDKKTMATYPDSWIKTESISNRLVSKILGFKVDYMTAVFLLNRQAAELICQKTSQKSWGACAEYLLLAHQAGLSIDYYKAKGLTWENPDRFGKEIKKAGGLEAWQKQAYDSLKEWDKRITSANMQFEVVKRFWFL